LTGLAVTLGSSIGIAIACTAVNILLSRRWWIPPALLLAALAACAILVLRMEEPRETLESLLSSVRLVWWILTGYTAPAPAVLPYLTWLCVWVLTIPLLLVVRRLFSMLALTVASAAVFVSLWIAGLSPSIEAMSLCIAGLASLFPRRFAWSVNRRARGSEPLARGAMQILAVPVTILCITLALSFVPENTAAWRLRVLVNSVTDFRDLLGLWNGEAQVQSEFSIADFGYQPLGGRLGGPIQPSPVEYLRLQSNVASLYIRGGVRDTYTGTNWLNSEFGGRYRFGSVFWRGVQTEAFDTGRPAGGMRTAFLKETTYEANYSITHMVDGMPFFFIGNRPDRIKVSRDFQAIPYFNDQGEVFTYDTIPIQGTYNVRTRFFSTSDAGFNDRMLAWEKLVEPDPAERTAAVAERYLQLPPELPDTVGKTAAEAAGDGTPYERAIRLVSFFQKGFTYTLSPVIPPESGDFVAHFLTTRAGYCVYFATAMTVMARTQGLPARYVEGFISPSPQASDSYSITGKMAHSWVEIYFDGIGWVPFDPTPGQDPNVPVITPDVTPVVEEPTLTPEPEYPLLTPIPPYNPDPKPVVPFSLLAAVILLLLIPPAFWLTVRIRKHLLVTRYRLASVRRRFANRERQMSFYHRDILRQLACLDIHPESGETLTGFARRADRRVAFMNVRIEDAADVVLRRKYGLIFPTGDDIALLGACHAALEIHLQATLNPGQYLRKRVFGMQSLLLPEGSEE